MDKTEKDAFKLIGLKLNNKTTNVSGQSGIDCGNLWQKFETGNFVQRIPGRLSDEIYAVYYDYEGDHSGTFSYFIGCKVKPDTQSSQDMDSLIIPAGSYYKVIAKGKMPDCIANTWKGIRSLIIDRTYQFDFEIYDARSKDWSNAEVEVFISSN